MEGVGELVAYIVTTIFTFMFVILLLAVGQLGFDIFKGVEIVNQLNRYEQIETDMNTTYTNTDVTTASAKSFLQELLTENGLPASDETNVQSILTSASVPNTNRLTISTQVCYAFPVLTSQVGFTSSPTLGLCIPMSGLRQAP